MSERVKENGLEKTEAYITKGQLTKRKPNNEATNRKIYRTRQTDALAPVIVSFYAFVVYSHHEYSKYLRREFNQTLPQL